MVAHLHETELAFDHPKWMLYFGTHTSLELLSLVYMHNRGGASGGLAGA